MRSAWTEVDEALSVLPGCDDELFERLWVARGLSFAGANRGPDSFDEYSARLVCANCTANGNLLVVLPDDLAHRPALLFATALIRYWVDSQKTPDASSPTLYRPVLYFGSAVGIREQLPRVRVRNRRLDLSEMFQQEDAGRRGTAVGRRGRGAREARSRSGGSWGLPKVLTMYSPADPVSVLEHHKPEWIAVDYGDAPDAGWLEPLLKHAIEKGIWIVAWGYNPLSQCVGVFRRYGEVFPWPPESPSLAQSMARGNGTPHRGDLPALFSALSESKVNPLVLDGPGVGQVDEPLGDARRLLLGASRDTPVRWLRTLYARTGAA